MGYFWKMLLFVFLILSSGISSRNFPLMEISSNLSSKGNNMAECLLFIMRDPSLDFVVNIQIRTETESKYIRSGFVNTIERLYASNNKVFIGLDTKEIQSFIHCRFYFIDSLISFRLLISRQQERHERTSADRQYYLIILPNNIPSPGRMMEQIFRLCWSRSIINVNVLIEGADGVITIYTYYPFTEKSCTNRTPTIYNRFVNGSFDLNQPTFPRKTNNYWQCPMRVVSWNIPPFVILNQKHLSGLDANIVLTLAKVMNFSLEIVISTERRGQVYSNENSTGAFKMLRDGLGDVVIGDCSCTQIRHQFFDATSPYHMSNVHIIIKRPETYSPLEILLFPFDWWTWFGLLIIFIGKQIGMLVMSRAFSPRSKYFWWRLCVISWLISTMILRSSYEGSIFNFFFNRPRKTPPHNLNETIDRGYKFVVTPVYYAFLSSIPELRNKMITFDGTEVKNLHFFDQRKGKYGLMTTREYLSLYNDKFGTGHRKNFIVHKPVVASYKCFYLPKLSFITVDLSRRLEQMVAHGYIHRAQQMHAPLDTFGKKIVKGPTNMSLQQLMGAFQLFIILIGISAWAFVMEVLSKYNRRLRMVVEVFH